jgi:drug/metabolite transporter (DMT)-like permease
MLMAGIFCGLVTAICQAMAYLFSRRYVVIHHTNVLRLMVMGHALIGAACAVALPLVAWRDLPNWRIYLPDLIGAGGYYFVGQILLLGTLRRSDASRIAPLLGLKIVFVAVVAVMLLNQTVGPWQWAAVGLATAAAFMLNRTGGHLPHRTVLAVVFACILFSMSDVHTKRVIDLLQSLGMVRGPIAAAMLSYMFCGVLSAMLLPWCGSRRMSDWVAALPYAIAWLAAVMLLFLSYAYAGIVLAGIAMATRGLWSIALGTLVAKLGHLHIEQHVPRPVLIRRCAAAVMMVAAIVLYAAAEGR